MGEAGSSTPLDGPPLPLAHDALHGWHPLASRQPRILLFLVVIFMTMLVLTYVIHWSVALLFAVVSAHWFTSYLRRASRDAAWEARMRLARHMRHAGGVSAETVLWVNRMVESVWPQINSDYFVPFIDLLEDSLMQQVPPIVHQCRIEGMDQGTVAPRLLSIEVLDPTRAAFTGEPREGAAGAPLTDEVVLEVAFAYRRRPRFSHARTKSDTARHTAASNSGGHEIGSEALRQGDDRPTQALQQRIRMLVYMRMGLQKLAAVDLPVGVEIVGFEGRMRFRVKTSPLLPFFGNVSFTFPEMPRFELSAAPLGYHSVLDVMNLPLISSYVLHSIENVVSAFVAPRSYTLDMHALVGDGIGPQHSTAVGVLVVVLHSASGLAAADAHGLSDPFVQLTYARTKRVLYKSQVARTTLEPTWQETAFLLVDPDSVENEERLRLAVLDADRFSADDPLGCVEVSLGALRKRAERRKQEAPEEAPALLETFCEPLVPVRSGSKGRGYLTFSLGYYGYRRKVGDGESEQHAGVPHSVAQHTKEYETPEERLRNSEFLTPYDRIAMRLGLPVDNDAIRERRERRERITRFVAITQAGRQVTNAPASPARRCGILAFHIHSVDDVQVRSTSGSLHQRAAAHGGHSYSLRPPQLPEHKSEEESHPPSTYVQVVLNDETVYQTRTKGFSSKPFFNAGSERFVRDWTTARIDLCVREARMREADPVLGVAAIRLADVLRSSCRTLAWFPLSGGLGQGRIRLTLIFQPIDLQVPRPLSGWEMGVLQLHGARVTSLASSLYDGRHFSLMLSTASGHATTPSVAADESGDGVQFTWALERPLRAAVRYRYRSFVMLELHAGSRVPGRRHSRAYAIAPLYCVADHDRQIYRVPLVQYVSWAVLEQHALRNAWDTRDMRPGQNVQPSCVLEQLVDMRGPDALAKDPDLKHVGWLELDMEFVPGIAREHKPLVIGNRSLRCAYETYQALKDCGVREDGGAYPDKGDEHGHGHLVDRHDGKREACETPELLPSYKVGSLPPSPSSRAGTPERGDPSLAKAHKDKKELEGVPPSGKRRHPSDAASQMTDDTSELPSTADDPADTTAHPSRHVSRSERRKALHREHGGMAQIKLFRTASWVKDSTRERFVALHRRTRGRITRGNNAMETEGVSHF